MANIPDDRKYTKTHEWARNDDDLIEIGITDFAQNQLSDVTYVELPEVGSHFLAGKEMVVVESIKAAADIYAPIDGTITEINPSLTNDPSVINTDPNGEGWLVRITPDDTDDLNKLMSASDYEALIAKES